MGANLLDIHDDLKNRRTQGFWDDFQEFVNTQRWTTFATAGASITNADNVPGLLTLATGATLNNEAAVFTTRQNQQIRSNKPLLFEARINYQEANTNNAAVAVGFASGFGTGLLAASTGIPNANFSGALIYKQQGSQFWRCISSIGATQVLSLSTSIPAQTSDEILRVEIKPIVNSSTCEVSFFVDQGSNTLGSQGGFQPLLDTNTLRPIKHNIVFTGALKMAAGAYLRCCSATGESLNLDYIGVEQLR